MCINSFQALWSRFFPVWKDIKQTLLNGELGVVTNFHLNVAGRNPRFNLEARETPTLVYFV
jgi:predicted dehydrogenase